MTLFQRIEAIEPALATAQAEIEALKANPPSDVTAEQLAAVQVQLDAVDARVGTPAVPAA